MRFRRSGQNDRCWPLKAYRNSGGSNVKCGQKPESKPSISLDLIFSTNFKKLGTKSNPMLFYLPKGKLAIVLPTFNPFEGLGVTFPRAGKLHAAHYLLEMAPPTKT